MSDSGSQTPSDNTEAQQLSYITTKDHSFKQHANKPRGTKRYKTSKQLITDEIRYLQSKKLEIDTPTWTSIVAPPSLKPQKHYCDITGLEGKYKSPANALRFHNVEIYQEVIKHMPPGVDQEYLSLRGANVVLK
ncbi:uncharacterized protein CXQ87_001818 [Candidozyma duobushaemuli]|uniref:Vps72/YL1 C-terminal domain-containing protein n=1 Tax=Candidozyma duobushaemuli TaxID=1231522 RepID=A0A2V1A792_9ASCO|nr:uncharacterized protein CXQ87_001818 [[Candida] duobushaemulonis]PVH13702.1 hypothetical protein CXQ87_001818 [[Candida] duobushaemulonis]